MKAKTGKSSDFDLKELLGDYAGEDYAAERRGTFPTILALRETKNPGFFVTEENAEIAGLEIKGLKPYENETNRIDAQGEPIILPGYLLPNPCKVLIVRVSESLRAEQNKIVGKWVLGDKERGFRRCQRYMIFFLSPDNTLMHKIPFSFKAIGTIQWSLSTTNEEAANAMEELLAIGPRNERWHALRATELTLGVKKVGSGDKMNNAAVIKSWTPYTRENVKAFLLHTNREVGEVVEKAYDENPNFGNFQPSENPKSDEEIYSEFLEKAKNATDMAAVEQLRSFISSSGASPEMLKEMRRNLDEIEASVEVPF